MKMNSSQVSSMEQRWRFGESTRLSTVWPEGTKTKITVKFSASRRLHFQDTKRIMSPKMRTKSFGTFEKRAPGLDSEFQATCVSTLFTLNSASSGFPPHTKNHNVCLLLNCVL